MQRTISISMALAIGAVMSFSGQTQAWTIKTLHSFSCDGPEGCGPAGLIDDPATGDLFGATAVGGTSDKGTLFKMTGDGTISVLYAFTGGNDGGAPESRPIRDDAGNLYGTTSGYGAKKKGVIYKLSANGTYTVLHAFLEKDGIGHYRSLHLNKTTGDLYGVAYGGGAYEKGTAYRLSADGTYTVLHAFSGGSDGAAPSSSLVTDSAGNVYGTTYKGGGYPCDCGTVFKITPQGEETVLHAFKGRAQGYPDSLNIDQNGNLYGTGAGNSKRHGSLFKISASGRFELLHHFSQGVIGGSPQGHLALDSAGAVYGTTLYEVDQYAPDGTVQSLGCICAEYGASDGVIKDRQGNLFGTTAYGGDEGRGSLFEVVKQ